MLKSPYGEVSPSALYEVLSLGAGSARGLRLDRKTRRCACEQEKAAVGWVGPGGVSA